MGEGGLYFLQTGWDALLRRAQPDCECDQLLLCSVMKVALDSTARFVSGGDDARARPDELGTGGRVRDGRWHALAESGKALLRVRRERFVARRPGDDETPQAAFDEDRRADGGAQAVRARDLGGVAGGVDIAVDAGGLSGVEHHRRQVPPALW